MSLYGSLNIAGNALQATQIGLQVVGQNITNANTPGYIRESVNYTPAPTQQIGSLNLGLGVSIDSIQQNIDTLLEQRLRNANSDQASAQTQQQTFQQLESLTNELGDSGLGKSLTDFASSLNDVLNQPEDMSVRNMAVLKGQSLASNINRLNSSLDGVRTDLNKQIDSSVDDINRLTQQIATLNTKIVQTEAGNGVKSPAVGLRDQRNQALASLAQLVDVNVVEQPNGADAVYTGSDYLVFGDEARTLKRVDEGSGTELHFADSNGELKPSSGKVAGLIQSRDGIVAGFQGQLDDFANNLSFAFNKIQSSGQGLTGYQAVTSQLGVNSASAPLDAAGLKNSPVNGSFQLQVYNSKTGLTQSTNVVVDLNGLDHDTSLSDVASQLNAIDGVSASISSDGKLTIQSTASDQQIAFGNDTSGFLAAIGINTFFTGSTARDLAVDQTIAKDPSKLAASSGGVGADANNATTMASLLDQPLDTRGGQTLSQLHDQIVGNLTQSAAQANAVATGTSTFASSLQGQSLAISGVNIDDETIKMLALQHAYQASARFISTINDLLGVLMNL